MNLFSVLFLNASISPTNSETVFKRLKSYCNAGCLLAAGSKGEDRTLTLGRESVTGSIVGGHAYSILDIKTPTLTSDRVRLLKLRNPWWAPKESIPI